MVKFENTEAKISIDEINNLEKTIGMTLPKDYREHLLLYNGGQCFPNEFSFKEDNKLTDSCIDWFLAIYDGEYDNLINYIDIYKLDEQRIPTNLIPIAHDPGGNLICISCDGDDKGYIYFWDHEREVDCTTNNNYTNVHLISESFKGFIKSLKT